MTSTSVETQKRPVGRPSKHCYEFTREAIETTTTAKEDRQTTYQKYVRKLEANSYDAELVAVWKRYYKSESVPTTSYSSSISHQQQQEQQQQEDSA